MEKADGTGRVDGWGCSESYVMACHLPAFAFTTSTGVIPKPRAFTSGARDLPRNFPNGKTGDRKTGDRRVVHFHPAVPRFPRRTSPSSPKHVEERVFHITSFTARGTAALQRRVSRQNESGFSPGGGWDSSHSRVSSNLSHKPDRHYRRRPLIDFHLATLPVRIAGVPHPCALCKSGIPRMPPA